MNKHFTLMHIDKERLHVLTKLRKTKKGINIKESNHNVMVTEFDCKMQKEKETEKEKAVYNLKNKDCQEKFKLFTSNTKMLSRPIDDGGGGDVHEVTKRFLEKIDGCIATCFKRRRGGKKEHFSDHELYGKRRQLKLKTDIESVVELKEVEKK